jgi:hypothetical protein
MRACVRGGAYNASCTWAGEPGRRLAGTQSHHSQAGSKSPSCQRAQAGPSRQATRSPLCLTLHAARHGPPVLPASHAAQSAPSQRPAASGQQPAASSQRPAASSQPSRSVRSPPTWRPTACRAAHCAPPPSEVPATQRAAGPAAGRAAAAPPPAAPLRPGPAAAAARPAGALVSCPARPGRQQKLQQSQRSPVLRSASADLASLSAPCSPPAAPQQPPPLPAAAPAP